MAESKAFIGVDVGTGSVRSALVNNDGKVLHTSIQAIKIHNPQPDFYEQSSTNIWNTVCQTVKEVVKADGGKHEIKGIGFDATCSLVIVGPEQEWDIIMWMDHRAKAETAFINGLGHRVLDYVGGQVSLEMQTPKLLWLKKNLPEIWNKAEAYYDLADFLTFKATGLDTRSLCTLVCKWTYRGQADAQGPEGWDKTYFEQIGLEDLAFDRIGQKVTYPGKRIGQLTEKAAKDLGLKMNISVATGLIDAHAGALGLLATSNIKDISKTLSLICGTSTCHMILNKTKFQVPGIWGPYYSAVLNEFWLHEGGQSAVGSLIDHIIQSHPSYPKIKTENIYQYLESKCQEEQQRLSLNSIHFLTQNLHMLPDFHGNRSPLADPDLRGSIIGLSLDQSETSLALLYLCTIQALAYGTKLIVDHLMKHGHVIEQVAICGGLSKSDLFIQTISDVLNLEVIKPNEPESVLLGSAILAAGAANSNVSEDFMKQMQGEGKVYNPNLNLKEFHSLKYSVYKDMLDSQLRYRNIMNKV